MNSWYIWYEIYEDGKPLKNCRGRYYYPYKYRASAERRAKQMYSSDLYDPRTGVLQEWKWVVSQTNPWEDTYVFKSRADAEYALFVVKETAKRYSYATRADVLDYVSGNLSEHNFLDHKFGWMENSVKKARIYKSGSIYILEMPRALPIC